MTTPFNRGNTWRPDGAVRYRTDPATGDRVGILPASCRRQLHSLVGGQYLVTVSGELLRVECLACHALEYPDYSWILTLSGAPPVRAEQDDRPYRDIEPLNGPTMRTDR